MSFFEARTNGDIDALRSMLAVDPSSVQRRDALAVAMLPGAIGRG